MAKIQFGGVHLDHEVDRLGGGKGLAYAHTTYFKASNGDARPGEAATNAARGFNYVIELDTATGLVTVTAENGGAIVVPRERVKRFEPLPPAPVEATTGKK